MQVKVIIFGQLADITRTSEMMLANVADTEALKAALTSSFPALGSTKYMIAVNKKTIKENTGLADGSVVALLPPFSGG